MTYGRCAGCGVQESQEILDQLNGYHSSECERDHKELLSEKKPEGDPEVMTIAVQKKIEMHLLNKDIVVGPSVPVIFASDSQLLEPMFYLDFPSVEWRDWGKPEKLTVVIPK